MTHRCSTCGKRTLTFGGLMRHYLSYHRAAVPTPPSTLDTGHAAVRRRAQAAVRRQLEDA